MPDYKVKLVQRDWVVTEVFETTDPNVFPNKPGTKAQAMEAAEAFVSKHKELDGREYKFEVEKIEEPAEAQTVEATNNTKEQ